MPRREDETLSNIHPPACTCAGCVEGRLREQGYRRAPGGGWVYRRRLPVGRLLLFAFIALLGALVVALVLLGTGPP